MVRILSYIRLYHILLFILNRHFKNDVINNYLITNVCLSKFSLIITTIFSYPMSKYVQSIKDHALPYESKEAACHAIEKFADKLRKDSKYQFDLCLTLMRFSIFRERTLCDRTLLSFNIRVAYCQILSSYEAQRPKKCQNRRKYEFPSILLQSS